MTTTENYGLNLPGKNDFVEIDKINENTEKIDQALKELDEGKASASGGDISDTVITSAEESTAEYPVPAAGDSTKVFLGKTRKFFADIKNWMTGVCMLGQIVNNCVTDNAKLPLSAAQGKVLMDLYNVLNTNQQKKLLIDRKMIDMTTTLGQLYSSHSKGSIYVENHSTTSPSYGSGIILYASNTAFKAIFVDDNNHSLYLWSCFDRNISDKILDVVNAVKVV